ncbi:MAG: hypothetical protein HC831_18720 [Chloroflexia bacterium]|nr:hypothetical protein [Chloroflexia bacterium]
MRASTYQQYNEIFEEMANRHPSIQFFHEIDEDEIISGQFRSKIRFPAFILEYPALGFNDNRTNVNQVFPAAFAVLKQLTGKQLGHAPSIRAIMNETNIIMLDLISYLREKRRTDGNFYLETNLVKLDKVGPVFDACYGWRCELTFQSWVDLNFKPEEWTVYNPEKWK